MSLRQKVLSASKLARPRPAAPALRPDPTRLSYVRVLGSTNKIFICKTTAPLPFRIGIQKSQCLYKPLVKFMHGLVESKPGDTTVGSGWGARQGSGVGMGRMGFRQNKSPRKQASLIRAKASKKGSLKVFPEARTSETIWKPNAGTKSAVDKRFASGVD